MRQDAGKGEKERRKTHLADRGDGGCRSPLSMCVCAGQPSTEEERMWPDKMEREREICEESRKLGREVEEEILVLLAQAFVEWIVRTST